MTVTNDRPAAFEELTSEQADSIRLAVAQWLRSAPAVAEAQQALRVLGIAEDELLRRRRAESGDPELAALLRFAVTVLITRGRLESRDRRGLRLLRSTGLADAAVDATAEAYRRVLLLESRAVRTPGAGIDLDVGDY